MSLADDEAVNNLGPLIVSCQNPPVFVKDKEEYEVKVLIQSKKVPYPSVFDSG